MRLKPFNLKHRPKLVSQRKKTGNDPEGKFAKTETETARQTDRIKDRKSARIVALGGSYLSWSPAR